MNKTKMITVFALLGFIAITSCKKNYTCTCNTVIVTGTIKEVHSIDNAYYNDAKNSCQNYQDQANKTLPGGTKCGL